MSRHAETNGTRPRTGTGRGQEVHRDDPQKLDLIACDGCGRRFATGDGPGMIRAIKGPCPDCGGRFQLISGSSEDA